MGRVACWLAVLFAAGTAAAQSPAEFGNVERPRTYDSLQAGQDAYRLAEERRRNNIAAQSNLVETLRYSAAYRPVYGEATVYWRSPYVTPWGYAPGYYSSYSPVIGYVRDPNIPFPRQPIGQRQLQTGPNRWESHPVYAEDPPPLDPLPPVSEFPSVPIRPKISGPREY